MIPHVLFALTSMRIERSGRLRPPLAKTNRIKSSFVPSAVSVINSSFHHMWDVGCGCVCERERERERERVRGYVGVCDASVTTLFIFYYLKSVQCIAVCERERVVSML